MKPGACLFAFVASLACSSAALAETFPTSGSAVPYRETIQRSPCPVVDGACVATFDPVPEGKVLVVTDIYCVAPGFGASAAYVVGGNGSRPNPQTKTVGFLPFPTTTPGLGTVAGANLPFAAAERPKIAIGASEGSSVNMICSITGNLFQAS